MPHCSYACKNRRLMLVVDKPSPHKFTYASFIALCCCSIDFLFFVHRKSTQCPQYILEDAIANGRGANTRIVVTQPRRIAAISVAERVAAERDEKAGKSVGFSVRFNTAQPREEGGCIEFVTTGILLRRLVNDPTLDGISHVMIDEVHERDIEYVMLAEIYYCVTFFCLLCSIVSIKY